MAFLKKDTVSSKIEFIVPVDATEAAKIKAHLQVILAHTNTDDLALLAKVARNPIYRKAALTKAKSLPDLELFN